MAVRPIYYAAAFTAGLALLGCSPGEPDAAGPASEAGEAVSVQSAEGALALFGLDEPGRVSWESRSQDGAVFTFEAVTITDPDGGLSAERLVIDAPQETDEGPVFARFELSGASAAESSGDLVATFDRLLIAEAGPEVGEAVAAALTGREALFDAADPAAGRFGEMRIEGLSVTGTSETGAPLDLSVATAMAAGHDGRTIETLSLEQLSLVTADDAGAPVTISLGGASARGVAAALAGLAETDAASAAPLAGALTPNNQYDSFSLSELDVRASGVHVVMPGLSGVTEAAGEDRVISRTVMERLTLSADAEAGPQGAELARSLDQLGYEALNFSLENTVAYDLAADRVETIEENYLRLEDGFTLRFEQVARGAGAYADAYAAWLEAGGAPGETPPAEVFEPLMIERMVFALDDQSLLDRSLGALAEMQGVTPEQLRVQAGAYVALGAAFAGDMIPPQLLSELQGALTGFIGQGGTLSVTMAPSEPVSMSTLMQQNSADADTLGLTVTHEAP